eukprot:scaffold264559_cov25-Prasinocladus_malaysianus.AAC.1
MTGVQIASLREALRERDAALQQREAEQAQVSSVVRQQEADIIAVSTEAKWGGGGKRLQTHWDAVFRKIDTLCRRRLRACSWRRS